MSEHDDTKSVLCLKMTISNLFYVNYRTKTMMWIKKYDFSLFIARKRS